MTSNLPIGLQHVLQVYRLVRRSRYDRLSAIKEVARQRRVDPQTISSACTRSLGLTTPTLEELLHPRNAARFREHLIRRFPAHQSQISEFLAAVDPAASEADLGRADGILEPLFPEEKRQVLESVLLQHIQDKLAEWSGRPDVPEEIRQEMRALSKEKGAV